MMAHIFIKKFTTLFFLVYIFAFYSTVFATDIVDFGDVTVSARVIDPNIIITPVTPTNNGGNVYIPKIAVSFSGEAYPQAPVVIMKDGVQVLTVVSDSLGRFNATLEEKYDSTVLYSIYSKDILGNRSLLLNYPVAVHSGYVTELKNIRFSPTIILDKSEISYGDYLSVSGYSLPNKEIQIFMIGSEKKIFSTVSNLSGFYSLTFPLTSMPKGDYNVHVKYTEDEKISKIIKVIIGNANKPITKDSLDLPGDCNKDGFINLIDFSVLAFWYKKPNPPVCVDVNTDKTVDLVDFSILAYYWTG